MNNYTSPTDAAKPKVPTGPIDYSAYFFAIADGIDQLNKRVSAIEAQLCKAPETKPTVVQIGPVAIEFDSKGYKYYGLVVAGAQTITVNVRGLSYTVNLVAGYNKLVLIDGALISAAAQFTAVEVYSDHLEI